MTKKTNPGLKIICLNRKASFNFFFEDLIEAGIVLKGSEIKSKELNEDQKVKLMSLSGVKQYPMRVKCATLSWHTLVSALDGKKIEINTEKVD